MTTKKEADALERAITGALRSAIHDHGAITPAKIGSATKRVVGNLKNARARQGSLAAAAAQLGQKGGKAGVGASKRRTSAHYRKLAAERWAGMTAEERSAEMKRRRRKGMKVR